MYTDSPISLTDHKDFDPRSILKLFDSLGDVYLFIKGKDGKFLGGNPLQLQKLGLEDQSELIGKSDEDFFPSYMIGNYARDDAHVIETQEPILRRTELVANADGSMSWHVTSKFPLRDRNGACIGIVGYMRDFESSENAWQPYRRMNAAIEYISEHYSEHIEISELARRSSLSVSQFERRFRKVFEQTPARFLIRYRLTRASQALVNSEATISEIAHNVGFYDHSHFSREFKKLFGMSPGHYRKAHLTHQKLPEEP